MKKLVGTMMVAASALVVAGNANALEYNPYVGVDYVNSDVSTKGAQNYKPHFDGGSINVGMNVGKYFGAEVFAQATDTDKRSDGTKANFRAWGVDAYGYLPFGCDLKFALLGTVGVGEYTFHGKNKFEGAKTETDHGWGWRVGAGAQYAFTDKVAARAIVRNVNFDSLPGIDHMIEYVAGVRYTF